MLSFSEKLFKKCLADVWPRGDATRKGPRMAGKTFVTIEIKKSVKLHSPSHSVHIFRFKRDVVSISILGVVEIERR